MSPKIVFFGPPNAGKSTLRKVFFEQESPEQLIISPLEPTLGIDRLTINYEEKIGIFDLAGQQNQQWLETEDKEVFKEADVIIFVISVDPFIDNNSLSTRALTDSIFANLKQIVKIRNQLKLNSIIYLLIHKIDLLDDFMKNFHELNLNIRIQLNEPEIKNLIEKNQLKIEYTSIVQEYLSKTFLIFSNILRASFRGETTTLIKYNTLENIMSALYNTNDILEKEGDRILGFTREGKKLIKDAYNEFGVEISIVEKDLIESPIHDKLRDHPFLGFWISDNETGILIYEVEIFSGFFDEFLGIDRPDLLSNLFNVVHGCIPMEMNIKNLSEINIKGINLKLEFFGFERFSITLFMLPSTNIKYVQNTFNEFFKYLFNMNEFETFKNTKNVVQFENLCQASIIWLKQLNELYKKIEFGNRTLFDRLNKKRVDIDSKYILDIKKIKQLIIDLYNALSKEDSQKIDDISNKLNEIG